MYFYSHEINMDTVDPGGSADVSDPFQYQSYSALDFIIGLLITLGASVINALGLNITKLDFTRQELLNPTQRRPDWQRGLWWLGLLLYIASQVVGSTLALEFMRAEYVAPLGATSLIFNFVFAFILVGTPVTRSDIIGTAVIVVGVIGVVVFGQHRRATDFDKETNLSLSLLKQLWGRPAWIVYLTLLDVIVISLFWFSTIAHAVCMHRITDERGDEPDDAPDIENMVARNRPPGLSPAALSTENLERIRKRPRPVGAVRVTLHVLTHAGAGMLLLHHRWHAYIHGLVEAWSHSQSDNTIRKLAGLCWSLTGGLLAGQTLVMAKSAVKLVASAISDADPEGGSQFASPLSWLIILLLIVCAVAQVVCLNASLKCFDSTLTVPVFFATYTISGFLNSLVYLDEFSTYAVWVFVCIWISIAVLIAGVVVLSLKKPLKPAPRQRASSLIDHGAPEAPKDTPNKPDDEDFDHFELESILGSGDEDEFSNFVGTKPT